MSADRTATTRTTRRRLAAPLRAAMIGAGMLLGAWPSVLPAQTVGDESLFDATADSGATSFEAGRSTGRRDGRSRFGDIPAQPVKVSTRTLADELPPPGMGATGFNAANSAKARPRGGTGSVPRRAAARTTPPAGTPVNPTASATLRRTTYVDASGRPRRRPVPEADPYAPLGIRAGGLTLWPALELSGGYDSNPERSETRKGSSVFVVAPELKLRSDWSRHAVSADLKGSYTTYGETFESSPRSLDRPSLDGKAVGRLDVSKDDRIEMEGRLVVGTDNPGSPNVNIQTDLDRLPVFTQFGASLGYAHTFNRFELSAKGGADRRVFGNSKLIDGTTADNDDRQYNQFSGTLRGSYELLPGVKPFAEVMVDTRVHDQEKGRYDLMRDSDGVTVRAGTTFELSRKLTGELSVGYLTRTYKDPSLPGIDAPVFDSSLLWSATPLTTVTLTARSTVDEVIVPGGSGVLKRDVAVQADHAFRRWLTGTLRVGYGQDDYVGLSREDERYFASLGLLYKLNRYAHLKGELRRDWQTSSRSGNNFTADAIMLGVRLQQ
ncbi:outer membrane beta-barrel protein [Xanthobacteraceae bacterium Astr-EGSB]|uniref:outer membrane beta-barrel protein n=1 Tax=Astrobacterium formosum TaxID=3069710 RepID=UPI0027AFEB79|nr:outer membrane beta-barrel protein [Xanthobacteraceae bacterium Astr-EGSB]